MGVTIMGIDDGDRLASVDIIPNSNVGDFEIESAEEELSEEESSEEKSTNELEESPGPNNDN